MPLAPPPRTRQARTALIWRWASSVIALVLLGNVLYLGFVGYQRSQVFGPHPRSGDCRTPTFFGWTYEAINYDIASDHDPEGVTDLMNCPHSGQEAGAVITAADGVRIAGWWVPTTSANGARAPTVVLAHQLYGTKSQMLEWAAPLHSTYNLVFFDFRNQGQSSGSSTTMGVKEADDLRAVVDWVEEAKQPPAIALLGVSMGAATAIDEAATDPRIRAVVMDSSYATVANALQAWMERDGYPLALPGAWATLLGGLLRTGVDMTSADPVQAIALYGHRPVLIVSAGADDRIGPHDADDLLAAARRGGAAVELQTCRGAAHTESIDLCPADYRGWVLDFLERSLNAGP